MDQGKATGSPTAEIVTPAPQLSWQPIETAPKDGSLILIGGNGCLGWFVNDAKWDGAWMMWSSETDEYDVECLEVWYWAPFPAPPADFVSRVQAIAAAEVVT